MFEFLKRYFSFNKKKMSFEKAGVSITKERQLPAEINIGLDFGTSFTKACWYYFDKDQRYIVKWNPDWNFEDPYFLPSIVWLDDHNILSMTRIESSNQRQIKFFKMAIAEETIGERILPNTIETYINPYYLYTAFYISRCLWWIQQEAIHFEKGLSFKQIIWSGNVGIPISYFESKKRSIFNEIIAAACYMQKKISDTESIELLDALYRESLHDENLKYFSSIPELYAEGLGFFSDYHTPEGYYTIFDVGGGTVDGAVIEFTRNGGESKVNFITSSVKPLGMEYIALFSNNKNKMEALQKEMMTQTAELIMKAKSKVLSRWRREGTLPILMCGGGHSSEWHIKFIKATYWHMQHNRCGIPPYEINDLHVYQSEIIELPPENMHRFLIAIGLSFPEGMGPTIVGFPKNNPEEMEEVKKRDINYDEIQKERYGEY